MRKLLEIGKDKKSYQLVNNKTGQPHILDSMVEVYYTEENLVFNFISQIDETINSYGACYNDSLYNGDIVEILLTLGHDNFYLEVEINPEGQQYVTLINNKDGDGDIAITKIENGGLKSSSQILNNVWIVNTQLNLDWLYSLGYSRQMARINLHRQDFLADKTLNLYSYSPNMTAKFHLPQYFADLKIEEVL